MRRFFVSAIFLFLIAMPAWSSVVVEEILARVGNEVITRDEYEQEEKRLYDEVSKRYQGDELQKAYDEQRKQLLDFMINQKLLEQRAAELNISVDDEVNAAVRKLREENQIPDDQSLNEALHKEGSSLSTLREDFRKRIIQQKILWNYVQGKVTIREEEIKKYYDEHKSEMVTEPSVKISRFSISDADASKEDLKTEAQSALSDLRAGKQIKNENYPHLKTEDASQFSKSEMNPRLAEIIEGMTVGAYSEPFETSTGWMIIHLQEKKESEPIPFDQARQKIYNFLVQERADKYRKSFLDDLRKQSYVVVKQKPA
jgi:parvulin-like peptidyl-prolyl isomerase